MLIKAEKRNSIRVIYFLSYSFHLVDFFLCILSSSTIQISKQNTAKPALTTQITDPK